MPISRKKVKPRGSIKTQKTRNKICTTKKSTQYDIHTKARSVIQSANTHGISVIELRPSRLVNDVHISVKHKEHVIQVTLSPDVNKAQFARILNDNINEQRLDISVQCHRSRKHFYNKSKGNEDSGDGTGTRRGIK